MRIWYDACTGKHVRYGAAIAKHLRKSGNEVIFTTREHPDTLALARMIGEDPIVVGKYSPDSLFSRLEESASRVIQFSKLFEDDPPDVAISSQSVELCRTAFGLGIPIVMTADTPHAKAVNKLTIPFAAVLVVSEALPKRFLEKYCPGRIVRFRGVDEVAWIKNFEPPKDSGFKKPVIVVREFETKAAYALGKPDSAAEIAEKLAALGNVLLLKRYDGSGEKGFVDSLRIVANADLVVSAGGTISREAALQGVPSIVASEVGRTYVNTYLVKKGFPLFITTPAKVFSYAKRYIGKRVDVRAKLAQLENPVDAIWKASVQVHSASKRKIKD